MEAQVRVILEKHHASFLGDGNAVPAPARCVVCDLDVGDAKPVVQRARPIKPQHLRKVYELLEKLVQTKLIEYSDLDWASPIVIVMKKNGVDIQLCIAYRLVNQLIKLMHYPLPLIDDLLIGFESTMWFMSLDMASGFWAVPMTLRAKHISAFICLLGHFQWTRMPFGLKNAPLIYQQMLDNCLWGFVRLPASEKAQVDADVLEFLGIEAGDSAEGELSVLTDNMTVFQRHIPAPPQLNPVLGRSSYIDDIALPKSEFGKKTISYLSHEIGAEGIRAKPKIAKDVKDLPFLSTLKGVQSFHGSLNYYKKFIENLPVVAAVLYELTDEKIRAGRDLIRAREAFGVLTRKIVSTPLLRHPDSEKPFVIIVHANPWAACAVLGQEYDGVIFPVCFTGRVLHDQERNLEVLEADYEGWLLSFDDAAKMSDRRGSADATVNEAEYHGLIEGMRMALARRISEVVVVGDSRIAIQQAQGLIQCLNPRLQLLLNECEELRLKFKLVRLVHVKRKFNAAAVYLTSKTLVARSAITLDNPVELAQLKQLNRIAEKLVREQPLTQDNRLSDPTEVESKAVPEPTSLIQAADPLSPDAKICVVTRSQVRAEKDVVEDDRDVGQTEDVASEEKSQDLLLNYLKGNLTELSSAEADDVAKIANQFVLESRDALYYLSRPTPNRPRDQVDILRLVVPHSLQADHLHLNHEDFQGTHQGITRTFERLRRAYYWPGMYADAERFVKECVDCVTVKGALPNPGPSPGNIQATRPFAAVSMDFVTQLPKSDRVNGFLLLFQCMFSGFVNCKPMSSATAQEGAEAYIERVFQRFGDSEMIRHDRYLSFISQVFAKFREMLGSRHTATLAYRPQANGQQERSVQTVIRAVRAYVAEPDQSDWDDQVEKLMWVLNTSFDATRLDTPFYLVHGWDSQNTVSAMLGLRPTGLDQKTAYEWRRGVQRQYEYAQAWARDLQAQAKAKRSEAQTKIWQEISKRLKKGFAVGDAVWLYLARVQPGLTRTFAHLWHGPFRILETSGDFRCKVKIEGSGYKLYPWVHVSRLKPGALFPERPIEEVEIAEEDDFGAALLAEDVNDPDEAQSEYDVESIQDVR
ncbi:unnamed protein product [Phytophthora fragariaefolia]|uniref:Unnamed protein product n=1 Tax=Phytophthora fragariaefolia TaxID=1490495 RepID=A0A9W7CRW0_9STRA|nr:unnamed protein product [Phytophthora fragariaefolia]